MNRFVRDTALLALGFAVLGLAALPACAQDGSGDWVALFNGKDLDGWEAYDGKGKQDDFSKNWVVEDGVIHGRGPVSHLFAPKGPYKNFRYRAELKVADRANSGMYFRTQKGPGFPQGYEAQVNSTHGDPVRTGSLYHFVLIKKRLVEPDTWFKYEVEARGNHITIKVNDDTLYEFVDNQNSFTEGFFAFQQHDPGSQVWIRKVEVMELP